MRFLPPLIIAAITTSPVAYAQSALLESVKKNPQEAISLCTKFKGLNSQGISASSKEAINKLSKQRNLSKMQMQS